MRIFKSKILHTCLIRLLFYGLFFAGPYFLTESHSFYVRMRHESSMENDVNARQYIHDHYYDRVQTFSALGFSCIGIWSVWLVLAIAVKIRQSLARGKS